MGKSNQSFHHFVTKKSTWYLYGTMQHIWKKYLHKYNDPMLFFVLIPFINTINYHLTYSNIRWDWYTITTYLIDTAQGFIAWGLIKATILWFDKKMPYEKGFVKRIIAQLLATNVVAQGFIVLATELINMRFGDGPLPIKFYTYNLFIFFIWVLVLNGIYIGFYFYDQWHYTLALRNQEKKLRSTGFEVLLGNKTKNVPFGDIAFFLVEDRTTYLQTMTRERFVLDDSLNKIVPRLPEELFFRVNRKYIVHRNLIKGYRKAVNGKLVVGFHSDTTNIKEQVISRINAPHFKKWFRITAHRV
ncbi:MAG: LytTR family DNA-binding domain-containing protein [Bacteroidota bacterium]